MANLELLHQLKSHAEKLAQECEQAKLEKTAEHVSAAVAELDTLIQIAKFNRR